jgi:hypothetical protein
MKLLNFIFLLIFSTLAHTEPIHLQAHIVDAQTEKPIPGATVSVPDKNFFYPADNEGKFTIDDDRLVPEDTLSISCIGYQTVKIPVKAFVSDIAVRLLPIVTVLNEVKVGYKAIKVGSTLKSGFGKASFLPGMEVAMFMAGSKSQGGNIKSVGYFLSNGNNILHEGNGDVGAPFRIQIYSVDSNGMPGKSLTKDIIIAKAKKNNQWFDVDVSGYNIENQENGFFVAFSLLDRTYYKLSAGYTSNQGFVVRSEDILTPHLAFSQHEFKESLSYIATKPYNELIWRKDSFGNNYLIRATIIAN